MPTGSNLIARFVEEEIRPRLAKDFVSYKKRDLVRMHGPFVQLLAISFSRSGTLRVHPTFFVVGADLSLPVIPQNVSLEVLDPWKWSFPGAELNSDFAERLVGQLESISPISFVESIASVDNSAVLRLFQFFDKKSMHWSSSLYLAHYLLAFGLKPASDALRRAHAQFDRLGGKVIGDQPPWRIALGQRILEMEKRLTSADGQNLCRADSERQAEDLSLPKIIWH